MRILSIIVLNIILITNATYSQINDYNTKNLSTLVPENVYPFSQTKSNFSSYQYWFNIGLGISKSSVANIGGNYNFSLNNNYFQIGYQLISRNLGLPYSDFFYKEFPLHAINLGIGKVEVSRFFLIANFIGPAFVFGKKPSNSTDIYGIQQTENFYTAGITVNSQIFLKIIPELGIGVELYGNMNFVRTMAEVRLSIHFNNNKF